MKVVLQYFDDCPNWKTADVRVREIIDREGLDATIDYQLITTQEDAEKNQFAGSPTFLIDGVDPFPQRVRMFGLACRVYATESGPAEAPSVEQLERILCVESGG